MTPLEQAGHPRASVRSPAPSAKHAIASAKLGVLL